MTTHTLTNPRRAGITGILGLAIALAVIVAWSNSLHAPFELDDDNSIVTNSSIRGFWSFRWLHPPATAGETVSGRPVLNFTFAVNHALGGLDVEGYHAANLAIHVLAALTLFGLARRTLRLTASPPETRSRRGDEADESQSSSSPPPHVGGYRRNADFFAFCVALLWSLHPLTTGAVTYVVQRAESLCGLFYLAALYAFVRGTGASCGSGFMPETSATDVGHKARPTKRLSWFAMSVACAFLAMGTKETAVTLPLVVLLYDRAFIAGSFGAAMRARWRIHACLAASWLLLGALVLSNPGRGGSAGFGSTIDSWTYLLTQAEAIVHYLRLAIWPVGLVFDYGAPTVPGIATVLPQIALILLLVAAVAWLLVKNRPAGFIGACFFLLLAPSSSVVPVSTQTIAEHRMYLPLIVVVVAVAGLVRRGLRRAPVGVSRWLAPVLAAACVVSLGAGTYMRNRVYGSGLSLWQDTVARSPGSARARHNLGMALAADGRTDEAIAEYRAAIAIQPNHAFAHFNLGVLLAGRGQARDAEEHFRVAVAADAGHVGARINLANLLAARGETEEALSLLRSAVELDPGAWDAQTGIASILIKQGRAAEAVSMMRALDARLPGIARIRLTLGKALEAAGGRGTGAEAAYRSAIGIDPASAASWLALANLLAKQGSDVEAERCYRKAIDLDARSAGARFGLGGLLAARQEFASAMVEFRAALAIDPGHVDAMANLGNCQLVTGRVREAIATYEAVLRLRPGDKAVEENLNLAREAARRANPGGYY